MGNTSSAANSALNTPVTIFWTPTALRRQRGEDAVLDLLGVAELLDQRQGDGLDALEDDRQPDDAGHERAGERGLAAGPAADALADLREHVGEDEHQQQRLHHGADDEQRPGS